MENLQPSDNSTAVHEQSYGKLSIIGRASLGKVRGESCLRNRKQGTVERESILAPSV